MRKGIKEKQVKTLYPVKKCPECFTVLGLHANECFSCGQKVKEPDERGIAIKPVDYKAYSIAGLAVIALFVYSWLMGWSKGLIRVWNWITG